MADVAARSSESYEREIRSLTAALDAECKNSSHLSMRLVSIRLVSVMLAEFHAAVSHPDTDLLWLRRTLHDEEHAELVEALAEGDLAHIARELADVVYVAYGTAHGFGIDLDAALREVHRANMQKANGPRRADGKAMKPEGFIPPDMTEAIRNAS